MENLRQDLHLGIACCILPRQNAHGSYCHQTGNQFAAACPALEEREHGIHQSNNQHQIEHIKRHAQQARSRSLRIIAREERKRQAVLVESHPEKEHHGKHKTKRGDALARLGRRQFLHGYMPVKCRLRVIIGMLESAAEAIVYKDGHDKRNTCHGKAVIVSFGQLFDVTLTENRRVARESLCGLERLQRGGRLCRHSRRIIHILVGKGRNLCIISEAVHAQHVISHLGGRRGGKQRTDVDGHVEEAERRVALVPVLWRIIEVADHDLQVAFEKSRAASNQCQRTEHHGLSGHISTRRDR